MKHPPGSFSKNFAWHGTGMRKLHTAIRGGFDNILAPVDRQNFRSRVDIESSIILIPINFFMHNLGGNMSVDELVFQAIERDHSVMFDRLALFALHLNRVGSGRDARSGREIVSRPAMWANEFVRERPWSNGTWKREALYDESIDPFLHDRMHAQRNVRIKCRNNYRHIFELCKFLPSALPEVNSQSEQWLASALFLAWDRHILDGGTRKKPNLIALVDEEELYKLLGVTREHVLGHAIELVDLYRDAGYVDRFGHAQGAAHPKNAAPRRQVRRRLREVRLDWLEQQETDVIVERRSVEKREHKRDTRKAAALKKIYDNTCQFCGTQLNMGEGQYYSEAAHVKGLGEPHNGPDRTGNMLILCPNHHLQFDRGVLRLRKVGSTFEIQSKILGDTLNGKRIKLKHNLKNKYVKHHYDWFS